MPQRQSNRLRKHTRRNTLRRTRQWESLEARTLLAGDLVGHWRAEDLVATVADQAAVSSWTAASGIASTSTGQPKLIHEAIAGQAAVRFNAADGVDSLRVAASVSPISNANDFTIVVVFATNAANLSGQTGPWYQNSGLVDGNTSGFGADWGLTINQAGKLSAGMGGGLGLPTETIYSSKGGLNDGNVHIGTLTRSGGVLNLYVDNVLSASTAAANAAARSQTDFAIGSTVTGSVGFTGDIAEVRIYNGQLSVTEVGSVYSELNAIYNNTPPVANADAYSFPEDADFFSSSVPASQGVLKNDTDLEGNALKAVLVTPPSHGQVVLNADGGFVYDSDPDYFGPDAFTYSARDSQMSPPATVSIEVTPRYDAAVAQPEEYKLLAGTVLNVAAVNGVLANDTNIDQVALQAQLVQPPANGSLSLNADGSFKYNPQGFAGTATFTYRINDGTGLSNTATVAIIVNTPPVAANDTYQTNEDATLNRTLAQGVTANDVDADGNAVTVTLDSDVQHGTLTLASDGSFSYRPEANYFGTDSFTYHLTDGIDPSNVATVTLNVTSVNDVPVANADSYGTTVGNSITIGVANGVLTNDTDVENATLSAELVSTTSHGTLTLNTNGSLIYQPQADFTGVDTFTYRATDGSGYSDITTVTLSVASLEQLRQVVINEVHVDPDVKTELVEFIELTNRSTVPLDVSGWAIRNAVDYVFPSGSIIQPNGFLVVTENPDMFGTKFGRSALGPWVGKLANNADTIDLWATTGDKIDEVDYQLGFPWPTYGDVPGPSIQLLNPAFDNSVGGNWRGAAPTPGEANSVFTQNAAPQLRQVEHTPQVPQAGQAVVVTVRATDPDGMGAVNLQYQLVNPGDYISETDPRYATDWTSIPMHDDGANGDQTANDGIYSVSLPGSLQTNRRLVRYRISAADTPGAAVTVPYADDPVPNFAYFVYNGVPDWTGSVNPGTTDAVTFSSDLLNSVPVYQLITTHKNHVDSQYISDSSRSSGYTGSDYLWEGTMVYDGVVYDHINYRARGGVWRYAMGKNMWKFDFARGHAFEARDNFGNKYSTSWDKLNFSAIIQQGDYLHRGEQGLFESVGFELFNLAGVEAPNTNYVHFRIIESADESGTTQYNGDFQGLYLAIEQVDGNFLDEHDLPDGNMYKIEGYAPESTSNQGANEPTGGKDVRDFIAASRSKQPGVDYWYENLNLQEVYSYQTIAHGIHHYDTQDGKNYYYFHNPDTGLWQIVPWDLDLTWANNMYGGEGHQLNVRVAKYNGFNNYTNQANIDLNNKFNYDYQNRVRELLDLLYNQEQTGMLIDQMAGFVYQPGQLSMVDADRAMWDANPINSVASKYTNNSKNNTNRNYKYYQRAATKDYAGMIQIMKDYVDNRTTAFFMRSVLSNEANIPVTPELTYTGPADFATDSLSFRTTNFQSPIGATFSAMKWRIAAITDPNAPGFNPYDTTTDRSYEINSTWESDVLTSFDADVTIPGEKLQPGKTYRVRVRMQDNDGHWSHWSEPLQFVASAGVDNDLAASLRFSEVNYNPGAASGMEAAAGFSDNNDFEFLELVNIGTSTIDLKAATLHTVTINGTDEGVNFKFVDGVITELAPGGRVLVVENQAAFETRYGRGLPVAGEWTGRLSNSSETLTLSAYGSLIQQFAYDDSWYSSTDGDGATLEIVNPSAADLKSWNTAAAWMASTQNGGTPGRGSAVAVPGDSNHDGIFNSADLVLVFQQGEYEDGVANNSTWEDGDWDGDREFTSADFVYAFTFGNYTLAAMPIQRQRIETSVVSADPDESDGALADLAAAVDELFGTRNWEEL